MIHSDKASRNILMESGKSISELRAYVPADADRRLANRAEWTFTYDKINRLKSYTHADAGDVRGNIWYDGRGRIWQRWNDNSDTSDWDGTLTRFVYDGNQLAQEIQFTGLVPESEWVYTYVDLTRDYLRQPGGIRQREGTVASHTDYFMTANAGTLEFKTERDPVSETIARNEHTSSLDQLPGSTFYDMSNLMTSNGYIEMYGGTTAGLTAGFDPLVQMGGRHYLGGLGRFINGGGGASNPQGGLPVPPGYRRIDPRYSGESTPYQDPGDGSGGGTGGGIGGGNSNGYECNCDDCVKWKNEFCDGIWSNTSWNEMCCTGPIEEPDYARCAMVLDPCYYSEYMTCFGLICGSSDSDLECMCDYLKYYPDDLLGAWATCGVCPGAGGGESSTLTDCLDAAAMVKDPRSPTYDYDIATYGRKLKHTHDPCLDTDGWDWYMSPEDCCCANKRLDRQGAIACAIVKSLFGIAGDVPYECCDIIWTSYVNNFTAQCNEWGMSSYMDCEE